MAQRPLSNNPRLNLKDRVKLLEERDDLLNGFTEIKEVEYTEFKTLYDSNTLSLGQTYVIINFQTNHIIPNTSVEAKNSVLAPPVERIAVQALSNSELSPVAYSLDHPLDILYYDITADWLGNYKPATHQGAITRRIDTSKGIDMPGDWRHNVLRRWSIDLDPYGGDGVQYVLWDTSVSVGSDINGTLANRSTPYVLNAISTSDFIDVNTFGVDVTDATSVRITTVFDDSFPIPNIHWQNSNVFDVQIQTFYGGTTIRLTNVIEGFRHWNCGFFQNNLFLGSFYHMGEYNSNVSNNFFTVGFGYFYPLVNSIGNAVFTGSITHGSSPGGVTLWSGGGTVSNMQNNNIVVEGVGLSLSSVKLAVDGMYLTKLALDQRTAPTTNTDWLCIYNQLKPIRNTFSSGFYAADLSNQVNKSYISGVHSSFEIDVAVSSGSPTLNITRFLNANTDYLTESAGIWNFDGDAGTYTLDTFEVYKGGLNHDIVLRPATGVILQIPTNNVTDGFVNTTTVTANGTNGEIIVLRQVADRWIASN